MGPLRPTPYVWLAKAQGHITMTYTALLNLTILRDDFSRLDKRGIAALLRALQQPDGRSVPCH